MGLAHTAVCRIKQRHDKRKDLFRLLVPEDREGDQGDGNDPEDDVFGAILFFFLRHKRSTAYMKSSFKCRFEFPGVSGLKARMPRGSRPHACNP